MFLIVTRQLTALSSSVSTGGRARFHFTEVIRHSSAYQVYLILTQFDDSTNSWAFLKFSCLSPDLHIYRRNVTLSRAVTPFVSTTQASSKEHRNGQFHVDVRNATRGSRNLTLRGRGLDSWSKTSTCKHHVKRPEPLRRNLVYAERRKYRIFDSARLQVTLGYMVRMNKKTNSATARLRQDYLRLKRDPVPYVLAEPVPSNILEW